MGARLRCEPRPNPTQPNPPPPRFNEGGIFLGPNAIASAIQHVAALGTQRRQVCGNALRYHLVEPYLVSSCRPQ